MSCNCGSSVTSLHLSGQSAIVTHESQMVLAACASAAASSSDLPKMFAYASHGSHVLVQAVGSPCMKAISATVAASPVIVVTFLAPPGARRMQYGRKGQVGTRPSAAMRP